MFDYDTAMADPDNCTFTNINQSWLPDEEEDDE